MRINAEKGIVTAMKNLKLGIWIFVLTVIEASLLHYIRIESTVPSVIFAFLVTAAILEENFMESAIISMICAVAASAVCGREFAVTFISYSVCGIYVFNIRKKPRYTKKIVKAVFHTAILSAIVGIVIYLSSYFTLNFVYILRMAVSVMIYSAISALIIYPLLYASVYKSAEEKRLIR